MLSLAETQQLITEWNDTSSRYDREMCVHHLIERQAEATPDAVAVVFGDAQVTYSELNRRANQLALYLRLLGVGPELVVGVLVERSVEMVMALLGILKAGAAYLPLEPDYPAERLAFMLEDARAAVVLAQQRVASRLEQTQTRLVYLDDDWPLINECRQDNPNDPVGDHNLAYVIYTSGSTGKPKGAMNTHEGLRNQIIWFQQIFRLSQADRILQKTPFGFDVSVPEFFWPLTFGAQLVMAEPGGHKDTSYLLNLITEQRITSIHFVPSMLQAFLEEKDIEKCQSLRWVICSGEALPCDLQEKYFTRLDKPLYNLYGPTEAAVHATFWSCESRQTDRILPIGRPVSNTQMYILDRDLSTIGLGLNGEAYIGGVQLARGYLNRPDLTAEKFIPRPLRAIRPGRASTARATSPPTPLTATSSSSAASTTRSRSGASALNWAR